MILAPHESEQLALLADWESRAQALEPAYLYHGTSASISERIAEQGIKPRRATGQRSNWGNKLASNRAFVYLTNCWPLFFASQAAGSGESWAIVEVAVELLVRKYLQFDEDTLAMLNQARFPSDTPLESAIAYCREKPWKFPEFKNWRLSLGLSGSCAHYGPISASAITRIIKIDPAELPPGFEEEIRARHFSLETYTEVGQGHWEKLKWVLETADRELLDRV